MEAEVLILEGGDLETSRPCERPRARLSQQHPHVTGPARALWLTQALAGAWAMAWEPPPSARARVVRARDAMWRARPAEDAHVRLVATTDVDSVLDPVRRG